MRRGLLSVYISRVLEERDKINVTDDSWLSIFSLVDVKLGNFSLSEWSLLLPLSFLIAAHVASWHSSHIAECRVLSRSAMYFDLLFGRPYLPHKADWQLVRVIITLLYISMSDAFFCGLHLVVSIVCIPIVMIDCSFL